jgi:hypothetical protein
VGRPRALCDGIAPKPTDTQLGNSVTMSNNAGTETRGVTGPSFLDTRSVRASAQITSAKPKCRRHARNQLSFELLALRYAPRWLAAFPSVAVIARIGELATYGGLGSERTRDGEKYNLRLVR